MQPAVVTIFVTVFAFAGLPASMAQAPVCNGPCLGGTCNDPSATCISDQCCTPPTSVVSSSTASTTRYTLPGLIITSTTTMSSSTCADAISNCAQYQSQCNNSVYRSVMYKQCRRTCNLCNGGSVGSGVATSTTRRTTIGTVGGCVNRATADGRSDCVELSYLCNNRLYYNLMTQQCPKTCGRC